MDDNFLNYRLAAMCLPHTDRQPPLGSQNHYQSPFTHPAHPMRQTRLVSPDARDLPSPPKNFPQSPALTSSPLQQHRQNFAQPHQQQQLSSPEPRTRSRRLARESQMDGLSQYAGIMRRFDIDQVIRIHISKLVSADPLLDDFYYQVYAARAGNTEHNSVASGGGRLVAPLLERGKNHRMHEGKTLQDQISRMVSSARLHPRATQLKLRGSLGNVAFQSSKSPRKTLDICSDNELDAVATPVIPAGSIRLSRFDILRAAEDCYARTIAIELLLRRASLMLNANPRNRHEFDDYDQNDGESVESLMAEKDVAVMDLCEFVSGAACDKTPRIILVLSSAKGMRLFPRILRLLEPRLVHMLLLDVFAFIQRLEVVRKASVPALFAAPCLFREMKDSSRLTVTSLLQFVNEVDTFFTFVQPAIFEFVSEAEWGVLASLILRMLEQNDLVRVCTSKVGLSLLTLLISRAELLRQDSRADGWAKLFPRLFHELQGQFHRFFPLVSAPPLGDLNTELQLTDDAVIWHFLALLAMAATPEQQELIVMEVRERILAIVTAARSPYADDHAQRSLANVNLFLNALGLQNS